jgi:hypothetical protein
MRRHLTIRLLYRLRPSSNVVPQFVGSEVARSEPGASFQAYYLESRTREGKGGNASHGSSADNYHVRGL